MTVSGVRWIRPVLTVAGTGLIAAAVLIPAGGVAQGAAGRPAGIAAGQ